MEDITVIGKSGTSSRYIKTAAMRKAKRLFKHCANVIEYHGIDHNQTEQLPNNRCRFHCMFHIVN